MLKFVQDISYMALVITEVDFRLTSSLETLATTCQGYIA